MGSAATISGGQAFAAIILWSIILSSHASFRAVVTFPNQEHD